MSTITFECEVTEYSIIPEDENHINCFAINNEALIINLMDKDDILIIQTEISKEDAIELANLILLKYKQ